LSDCVFLSVCKSQIGVVCQACRILLQYLLSHLQAQSNGETVATTGAMLCPKQLLLPIRALCSAEGMLQRADQISLTAIMKTAKLPAHIKISTPGTPHVITHCHFNKYVYFCVSCKFGEGFILLGYDCITGQMDLDILRLCDALISRS